MRASAVSSVALSGQITSCVCVVVLPESSLYVHVMVFVDVIGKAASVVAMIVPLSQLSVAVGPVSSLSLSEHCRVISERSLLGFGVGGMLSLMVTSCVCIAMLPATSVYVQVMVVSDIMGKLVTLLVTVISAELRPLTIDRYWSFYRRLEPFY